jgi:hypothetical protein
MNSVEPFAVYSFHRMKVRWIDSKSRQSREVLIDLKAILSRPEYSLASQQPQSKLFTPESSILDVIDSSKRGQFSKLDGSEPRTRN